MWTRRRIAIQIIFVALLLPLPQRVLALEADQLALVVNRNTREGGKLAELYAKSRALPEHRIIELDLPTTEEISFDRYERDVVPPIRQFLRLHDPNRKIKCLVTFYGVPFRIAAHVITRAETDELKQLNTELTAVEDKLRSNVQDAEKMAAEQDASFRPAIGVALNGEQRGQAIEELARRADHAGKTISSAVQHLSDPKQQQAAAMGMLQLAQRFSAPVEIADPPSTDQTPADGGSSSELAEDRRFDPAARQVIRARIAKSNGMFGYAKLLVAQIGYLSPQDTEACLDSELSLLWWTFYPRPRWQLNALNYHFNGAAGSPALMVSRLDAPEPSIVEQMILSSIRAEQQGLQGRMVIDSRGIRATPDGKEDAYGIYDQSMRNLAALVRQKTTLPLTFDEKPDVLPPHSVQDVSVYCGWYSVGKYVPACSFVPGAVGIHVASFEMTSLRDSNNTGWVRGLLKDGVSATLGPVSEPYLQAFPLADEFFPLLLTGRLTLAEIYWKTEFMASWRMCLVGDPLYTPFKLHPALKTDDLPAKLKSIFGGSPVSSAIVPTTGPIN